MWQSTIRVLLIVGLAACSGSAATRSADSTRAAAAAVKNAQGRVIVPAGSDVILKAARIAVGTAVGAGAGQLIGKNRRSTVIGGAVGTVAGGAVAVRYAHRDIIVSAGTPIAITLSSPLHVASR